MAKRSFEFKLLSYLDAERSNNPKDVVLDNEEIFADDLGSEQMFRIDSISASTTDSEITFGFTQAKVLYVKNLSTTSIIEIKLNADTNTAIKVAPRKVLYLETEDSAGDGDIDSIFVSNPDTENAVTIKLFVSN